MPKIKTDKTLTHRPKTGKHSFTITPKMGVVSNFPTAVCTALVAQGATYVGKQKSLKKG